jgi:hypothetical protein
MRPASLMLLLCLALISCQPPEDWSATSSSDSGVQVRIETVTAPTLGRSPIVVRVSEGGKPVNVAAVEITGDMTHAGMIPVIRRATAIETGLYRADTFEFTMAGDWVVTADIDLINGNEVKGKVEIFVPGK